MFGVPLDSFVRGGTSSSADDKRVAELKFDAQQRRAVSDREKALARIPIESGGSQLYSNQLTEHPEIEQSYLELHFVNSRGEPLYDHGEPSRCLADVVLLTNDEMAIIIACPSCFAKRKPLDQCQIKIRQTNKNFELDTSKAGSAIYWIDGYRSDGSKIIKVYRSAGVVRESEKFRCDCGWAARIVKNQIFPI